MMAENNFERLDEESLEEYILRLSNSKKENKSITWQSIADNIEIQFGVVRSESWVRKVAKESLDLAEGEELLNSLNEVKQSLIDKTLELKKERVKISDERSQNNAYIRKLAREETIKEIALLTAKEMNSKKILPCTFSKYTPSNNEGILCISDWHYGLDFKNPWNEFTPEICKERISKLCTKTIDIIKSQKIKKLHLVNLQDLIAGRIHLGLRLESRFDVITQTMHIGEMLAEFISAIAAFIPVSYYDTLDNHSRLEPKKNDAQDLESLARIIPWYLKERLKKHSNVEICENKYGPDLITFESMGHKIIGAHGDKDSPITAIQTLNSFVGEHFDMILMAHRHHTSMDESCNTLLVCNGSLMGTDTYAKNLRLTSRPSQNLIIVSEESPMEAFYRIIL